MPPKGKPSSSHSSRPSPSRSSRPSSGSSRSSHSSSSRSSYSRPSSPPRHSSPPPPPPPPRHSTYHGPSHHSGYHAPPPPPHHHGYAGPPPPPPPPPHRRPRSSSGGCVSLIAFVLLIIFIFAAAKFVRAKNDSRREPDNGIGWNDNAPPQNEKREDVYVPALGRDVPWSTEYESYYDKQTDCYFYLNTEVDPAIWQYWFEGISSDYGDYGWLEWDAKEKQWYVQTGETKWEKLPKNKASDLWHFD